MLAAALASWFTTGKSVHQANDFDFHPILEVAILFIGIFATMMPALDWLDLNARRCSAPARAGIFTGAPASCPACWTTRRPISVSSARFSATGAKDIAEVLAPNAWNLVAISVGAVFFGAATYIGNGPNFMVKAIADAKKSARRHFRDLSGNSHCRSCCRCSLAMWLIFFRVRFETFSLRPAPFCGKIILFRCEMGVRTLYNILFMFFFVLTAPYYFLRMWRRGNWLPGFPERFGDYTRNLKQALTNRQVVWLHAVSVGEVNLCTQLIRALEPRMPNIKIVVSTTTTTGMAELRRHLPRHISKIYYPIDRRKASPARWRSSIRKPSCSLRRKSGRTFLWRARDLRVPVFLANARLSDRSYRGYRRFGFLFRPLFDSFAGVCAQNEADAGRLREVGCRPEAVRVVGNLKFDAARLDGPRRLDVPALLRQIGVPPEAPILVGGSTHAGEEVALAEMTQRLRILFPKFFSCWCPGISSAAGRWDGNCASAGVKFIFATKSSHNARFRG